MITAMTMTIHTMITVAAVTTMAMTIHIMITVAAVMITAIMPTTTSLYSARK